MPAKGTDRGGMSPLQALIVTRMAEMGWDPKSVEARGVKHATLHRYMNPIKLKNLPRKKTLEELAAGLSLNYDKLLEAAVASLTEDLDQSWRAQWPLGTHGNLEITVVVDRVDRKPATTKDLDQAVGVLEQAIQNRLGDVIPIHGKAPVEDPKPLAAAARTRKRSVGPST